MKDMLISEWKKICEDQYISGINNLKNKCDSCPLNESCVLEGRALEDIENPYEWDIEK